MSDELEWFPLEELTSRLAELVWVEETLSEILAAWAKSEPEPRRAILFAEAAGHHGWHAEIVTGCLPTSEQLADHCEVKAPSPQWTQVAQELRSLSDADDSQLRIFALHREVYPWLDREIRVLSELSGSTAAKPLIRWLRFVTIDHQDHEATLQLLTGEASDAPARISDRAMLAKLNLRTS